ncbi:hypothetical protein [uncultured Fibrella sp.]|uniref:hypothetical protein n=1 Tax=uncultured Fibrella sp. TaxID=1284596 RepID=UPI0035C94B22
MKTTAQDPALLPDGADPRLLAMHTAVAGGLTVRTAITRYFGSKAEYYAKVSMADKLLIRRLAQQYIADRRGRQEANGLVKLSVMLETDRHHALVSRTEQLSIQKGRLITTNEYVNALIAADLRVLSD